jgi:aminoglycoside 3-N-acetyltransferase
MSERELVARTGAAPVTAARIAADLVALGVREGGVVLVHASLSQLGWVCGGAQAALHGILTAIGPTGTLVVPAHTNHLSDPSGWGNPPVPESWWDEVRASMPPFRADETPAAYMGAIADTVLRRRDAVRSPHPHYSFAAIGPLAETLCGTHELDWSLGPDSPIGRVGDHDGEVLLLGVGHDANTSLHVAEARSAWGRRNVVENSAPMLVDGAQRWVSWREVAYDEDDFPAIGAAFADDTGLERVGAVGIGEARLLPQRQLVEFAAGWIDRHRT